MSEYFIPFATAIVFLAYLQSTLTQQAYCWDPCQLECVQHSPRLCPSETILIYYDCCLDGCCQYVKWPNLLFLLFIVFLLLAGCCCCVFFLLTDSRQRAFQKQQQRETTKERNITKSQNGKSGQSEKKSNRKNGMGFKHKKHSTTIV